MTENSPAESEGIGGPFVTIATFCERVLEEKDGVRSIIRAVDSYTIEPLAKPITLPPGVTAAFETVLFVSLKAGDFRGLATVSIKVRRPSGKYSDPGISVPTTFAGGEAGNILQVQMAFKADEVGLYWADVEVDGRLLTRVPLRVAVRSSPATAPEPSSSVPPDRH